MPTRAIHFFALRVCLPTAILGICVACGPGTSTDAMEDGSSGSAGESTGAPPPATTMPGTTGAETTTAPTDDTAASTGMPAADSSGDSGDGFIPRPDMGKSDGAPLGEQCESDRDCQSRSCFLFGDLGFGLCSECAHDSECMPDGGPGTCSLGPGYALCTGGEPGTMCESSEGCAGEQVCAVVIEGSPFQFCSECATDAECAERGSACAPGFTAGNYCALPGTIPDAELCPAGGDEYCMSTHCTEALFMDMPSAIWLCGECSSDDDCAEGQVCMPAFVTNMDIGPSVCA